MVMTPPTIIMPMMMTSARRTFRPGVSSGGSGSAVAARFRSSPISFSFAAMCSTGDLILVIAANDAALTETPPDRIDRWLAARLAQQDDAPALSRSRIKGLIQGGRLSAGGETIANPSQAVKPETTYTLTVPPPEDAVPEAEDIRLDIVFEDKHLLVVNKPAGLVVHPAPGNPDGTLVNALLAHCGDELSGIGGVKRPGIVHRIDKDTSGLLVVAKTQEAHHGLVVQFAAHSMERRYHALVAGLPRPAEGRIEGDIGRSPTNRKKMAVVSRNGKPAVTHYTLLEAFGTAASLVECRLETGRTHQIRVHMTHIGHALIGDPLYGGGGRRRSKDLPEAARHAIATFPRQALHAGVLGFRHPVTGEPHRFESPLPADLAGLVDRLRSI